MTAIISSGGVGDTANYTMTQQSASVTVSGNFAGGAEVTIEKVVDSQPAALLKEFNSSGGIIVNGESGEVIRATVTKGNANTSISVAVKPDV